MATNCQVLYNSIYSGIHITKTSHHTEGQIYDTYLFSMTFSWRIKKNLSINGTEPSLLRYVFRHLFYEPHSITCVCCYSLRVKLCKMVDKIHILKPMLMNGIDFTEMSSFYHSWKWNNKNTIHWRKHDLMT